MGEEVLCSDLLGVANFRNRWNELDGEFKFVGEDQAFSLKSWMNVDDGIFAEIQSLCEPDHLNDPTFKNMTTVEFNKSLPADSKLHHLKLLAEERNKAIADGKYQLRRNATLFTQPRILFRGRKSDANTRLEDRPTSSVSDAALSATIAATVPPQLHKSEVILRCKIYKLSANSRTSLRRWFCDQEFEVCGSQPLSALRDAIRCEHDFYLPFDVSDRLDLVDSLPRCADLCKSALLFIEDTFYMDGRNSSNVDYSKHVRDFISEFRKAPRLGKRRSDDAKPGSCGWLPNESHGVKRMEDTTFNELQLRLGMPCLYQHEANCQHLIVFSDLRMLHAYDESDATAYPMFTGYTPARRVVCKCCDKLSACWVVRDSPVCPEAVVSLCNSCFRMLHYDRDGRRLCDFRVYALPDRFGLYRFK